MTTALYKRPTIAFEKEANTQLSNNVIDWHGEILDNVVSNDEYLAEFMAPGVEWENDSIDEERGVAFGKLYISRGDQTAWLPIIVKDFDMEPIDMFFIGDDGFVLSEENINMNLPLSSNVGITSIPTKSLERRNKVFSKLSSVNSERLDRYRSILQDKDVAYATRKAGTTEKLASVIENFKTAPKKTVENVGTTRVFDFMAGAKLATDYRYGQKVRVGTIDDEHSVDKLAEGISSGWERVSGIIPAQAFIAKEAMWSPVTEDGIYKVKTIDNEKAYMLRSPVGMLMKDGSFIGGDQSCAVAFGGDLDGKLYYVTGDMFHGEKTTKEYSFADHIIPFGDMRDDQVGILMAPTEDGVINLGKVRLIQRKTLPSRRSGISMTVMIGGTTSHFLISNKLSSAVPIGDQDPLYLVGAKNFEIPSSWEVALLDDNVELADSEGPAKLAGATVKLTPIGGDTWRFEKIGSMGDTRVDEETSDHMAARIVSMGFGGDLNEIVKMAHEEGEIVISGLRDRPVIEKTARELPSYVAEKLMSIQHKSRSNQMVSVKLASAVMSELGEDAGDTVDAILSLGLVDDENIQFFVDSIPEYEGTLRSLVKLLLKARLGMEAVDAITVKKAVTYLDATIRDLKDLRRTATRN